nr:MAG TPA: hypothetical protein [Caudoviricetes sp.]
MIIIRNGIHHEATAEEIAAFEKIRAETPDPTPTPETQIAELKAQFAALETILLGGETDG